MRFQNANEAVEWIGSARQAGAALRDELAKRVASGMCYYEGIHWIQEQSYATNRYGYRRLETNFSPDSNQLRVSANQISYRIQKVAASTYPDRIAVEAIPPDRDFSISTLGLTKAVQDAVNATADAGGMVAAARRANFNRCVAGTWGLSYTLVGLRKKIEGAETDDEAIRFFDFDPLKLTLDPFVESGDLRDHDVVVFTDAWTHHKITRELGVTFSQSELEKLAEIGHLTKFEQELASLSAGRLMAHYRTHSKTKGALVHQIHSKSPGSWYFDRLHVVIETPKANISPTGAGDGIETPFGGCGCPMVLLHAHQRPRSPWGVSDVMMMRDDQNHVNLIKTLEMRMLQKTAGWQWLVDKRSIPKGVADEDARAMFTNTVSGVVLYEGQSRTQGVVPPTIVQQPVPPQHLADLTMWHADQIREKAHRAEGTFGQVKSHVPDASFQRALDEADQVLGARVREDIRAYETILTSLAGTLAALVKKDSPGTLAMLGRAGLTGEDLRVFGEMDPSTPEVTIAVRESSVRFRSHDARRQDLQVSLQFQAIDPLRYRMELARSLDAPVIHMDGLMAVASTQAVQRVIAGEEWQPVPLGEYSVVFRDAFLAAMFDKKATPEVRNRLQNAIASQLQMDAQERSLADPTLEIQRQQALAEEQAAVAEQVDAQAGQPQPVPASLGDLLDQLSGQGGTTATGGTTVPFAEATA